VGDAAQAAQRDGAPQRELLKGEVEIDEFFLGGYEEGLKGGPQRGKKTLCGVAIEVRGRGFGRVRLAVLSDASGSSLLAFTKATTEPGAIVHTDGLQSYRVLAEQGYDHRRRSQTSAAPGEQLLPRAHRAISNLKAWMHGTHRGVSPEHLPVYLDEYVFRHNRRRTPRTLASAAESRSSCGHRACTTRRALISTVTQSGLLNDPG